MQNTVENIVPPSNMVMRAVELVHCLLVQGTQDHIQVASADLQAGDSTAPHGSLCQCSVVPVQHRSAP